MKSTLEALQFLFVAPAIVAVLALINWMTSPGDWWVQWPALGLGIAWFFSLLHVIRAVVVLGGIAAFTAFVSRSKRG